jgi:hypothetical protein
MSQVTERWQAIGPSSVDWTVGPYKFSFNAGTGRLWWWAGYFGDNTTQHRDFEVGASLKDALLESGKVVVLKASEWIDDVTVLFGEINNAKL